MEEQGCDGPEHVGTFAGRNILRAKESGVPGNVRSSDTSATIFGQVWSQSRQDELDACEKGPRETCLVADHPPPPPPNRQGKGPFRVSLYRHTTGGFCEWDISAYQPPRRMMPSPTRTLGRTGRSPWGDRFVLPPSPRRDHQGSGVQSSYTMKIPACSSLFCEGIGGKDGSFLIRWNG